MSKIIATYLPQFHAIPENDMNWGKGYTDWVAVKRAMPQYEGHVQPKIPLGNQYYDLSSVEAIRGQAELAQKYGVYGFGIYHYWFSSSCHLLETPPELILKNVDIDINFMFIWDNTSWIRTWSNVKNGNAWTPQFDGSGSMQKSDDKGVLCELQYGNQEDWKKHYDYLKMFFRDDRYIKIDNKPVFSVCKIRNNTPLLKQMFEYWDNLAKIDGFAGIHMISLANIKRTRAEYMYRYEPFNASKVSDWVYRAVKKRLGKVKNEVVKYEYDSVWKKIIFNAKYINDKKCYLGAFVSYDDTPRRGNKATVVQGSTPEKFEKYMTELLNIAENKGSEFVFLNAWNEWGEGAYLEPDEENGYAYLEALKRAVAKSN